MESLTYTFKLEVPTVGWVIIAVILAVIAVVVVLILLPILTFKIQVSSQEVRVGGLLSPKVVVERKNLLYSEVLNLSKHPELKPVVRLFGIGLPGYRVGWFKLSNGSKAYLAVGNWSGEAVVLKLRDERMVILAPSNVSGLIRALESLGWLKK